VPSNELVTKIYAPSEDIQYRRNLPRGLRNLLTVRVDVDCFGSMRACTDFCGVGYVVRGDDMYISHVVSLYHRLPLLFISNLRRISFMSIVRLIKWYEMFFATQYRIVSIEQAMPTTGAHT